MTIGVKICGLDSSEAISAVNESGADMCGFVFFDKSPRDINPKKAATLCSELRSQISKVGVFVEPTDEFLKEVLISVNLDYLQLHGNETVERIIEIKDKFNKKIIKAVAVADIKDIKDSLEYFACCEYVLFDTKVANSQYSGGSGKAFDWNLLNNISLPGKWILSGGLNAENIYEAIKISGAQFVDISGGVEKEKAVKSPDLIMQFVKLVKSYEK